MFFVHNDVLWQSYGEIMPHPSGTQYGDVYYCRNLDDDTQVFNHNYVHNKAMPDHEAAKIAATHVKKSIVLKKSKKVKKLTDIQKMQQFDPAALQETKKYSPRVYIYCQPSRVVLEALRLGIDTTYIKPTSELSHGAKFDIMFNDPVPEELFKRLATWISDVDIINNRICSRNLAIWLISEGVMPMTQEAKQA